MPRSSLHFSSQAKSEERSSITLMGSLFWKVEYHLKNSSSFFLKLSRTSSSDSFPRLKRKRPVSICMPLMMIATTPREESLRLSLKHFGQCMAAPGDERIRHWFEDILS